jgi:amidase
MFDEYLHYDGLGLAELIAKKEVSPKEVLEAAIFRAEKLNPELNAIVTPLYDYAHERAKQALAGPFAGVPFLLKDAHHALRGTPMSNGSRLHKGEISAFDSEIVRRFLEAGVVPFGKTNTPEYKMSAHTICEAWGATHNPWDVTCSSGGSSGGSAAAVAAGIVPMASATDEGGSIRLPASACGIFGLKPSRGRNPIGPDFGWEFGGQRGWIFGFARARDRAIACRHFDSGHRLRSPDGRRLRGRGPIGGQSFGGFGACRRGSAAPV